MKIKIGRYPKGVTLNPMEFVLDKQRNVMTFESVSEAKDFLRKKGLKSFKGITLEEV